MMDFTVRHPPPSHPSFPLHSFVPVHPSANPRPASHGIIYISTPTPPESITPLAPSLHTSIHPPSILPSQPTTFQKHRAVLVSGYYVLRTSTKTNTQKGKAKRKRWQEVVDKGTSQADAEKQYIELGEALIKAHLG